MRESLNIDCSSNFVLDCLSSMDAMDNMDDYIEEWHNSDSSLPLHVYLGLTRAEYALWLQDPSQLTHIINRIRDEKD